MFRLSRTSGAAWVSAVTVIAGLSYPLTRAAVPLAAAEDKANAAPVEFTADGKLKQPVGYRKWVYVGNAADPQRSQRRRGRVPEFHSVYMDPESFAHYEKTGKFRDGTVMVRNSSASAPRRRPAAKATSWASSRAWRPRSRTRNASRTSPATGPTSASATSIRSKRK